MIVFNLECQSGGHRFEGWFGSSDDFAQQADDGLVVCPQCGSSAVGKAPTAPNVSRKGNQLAPLTKPSTQQLAAQPVAGAGLPPEAAKMMQALAQMQAEALKQSRWVGDKFAEQSRAIHYGERKAEVIHGQATPAQATELIEEGIALVPLPFPVAPPDELN
jgi:hypothetical protein